ncbi:DUF3410 domain-containing protein, partial [bacterium]|nr:DUF3410 domain-containing protein [bacterium]
PEISPPFVKVSDPADARGVRGISPPFIKGVRGISKSTEINIKHAVNCVYDIIEDDKRMRKIVDEPSENRGKYFDTMRKQYPTRIEFHQAKIHDTPETIKQQLSSLGFKIN